jgi:hypothetical protein
MRYTTTGLMNIMSRIAYLFPDTNVFEQCLPLDQVDWSSWSEFSEIRIVITRPVQFEIDTHKNKGGDRLARKARRASSLIREILLSDEDYKLLRVSDPKIKLYVRNQIRANQELSKILDYDRPDDQLVGIVYAFVLQNPDVYASLLTHDTGPMASAKMIGVRIAPVPDAWLLPPEPSEAEKKIRSLEAEVESLKTLEPKFRITFLNCVQEKQGRLQFDVKRYEPLTAADVLIFLESLKRHFPITTDFPGRGQAPRPVPSSWHPLWVNQKFEPASDEEIDDYRQRYSSWLELCKSKLNEIHLTLEQQSGQPEFTVEAVNEGTRPANDVLITFRATGPLEIMPLKAHTEEDDGQEAENHGELLSLLPRPPSPPRGRWIVVGSPFEQLAERNVFAGPAVAPIFKADIKHLLRPLRSRDPNAFYYKPERPELPVAEFSLECKQWRHAVDPRDFSGNFSFKGNSDSVPGTLECHIHAENLSKPETKVILVNIKIFRSSTKDAVEDIIAKLR